MSDASYNGNGHRNVGERALMCMDRERTRTDNGPFWTPKITCKRPHRCAESSRAMLHARVFPEEKGPSRAHHWSDHSRIHFRCVPPALPQRRARAVHTLFVHLYYSTPSHSAAQRTAVLCSETQRNATRRSAAQPNAALVDPCALP